LHKVKPNTLFIGQNLVYLPNCHSTNTYLSDLVTSQQYLPEGTVIYTPEQTAGRGQRGNSWEAAPHQNLTFSLLLHPVFLAPMAQFALSMAVSLAVYDFLSDFLGDSLSIKWPNDLYYQHKKLGGVLIENVIRQNRIEQSIVGIGLNINQVKFSYTQADSLKNLTGYQYDLDKLLEKILKKLEERYLQLRRESLEVIKADYLSKILQFGERCTYQIDKGIIEGSIVDVDISGLLVVEVGQKTQYFAFKEITFLFP
jgi:BirA family biotin operon repressor/biotin-[acetyl-CoA-carboxylase] ligase